MRDSIQGACTLIRENPVPIGPQVPANGPSGSTVNRSWTAVTRVHILLKVWILRGKSRWVELISRAGESFVRQSDEFPRGKRRPFPAFDSPSLCNVGVHTRQR